MKDKRPRYVLRYFFDGATGTCLWAGNAETANAFDYPVDLEMLNLPESLLTFGNGVVDRWTEMSDQDDMRRNQAEYSAFCGDVRRFLAMLREQLGPDFQVLDESRLTALFANSGEPAP